MGSTREFRENSVGGGRTGKLWSQQGSVPTSAEQLRKPGGGMGTEGGREGRACWEISGCYHGCRPGLVSGALWVCYLSKFPLPLLELHLPISCSGRQRE